MPDSLKKHISALDHGITSSRMIIFDRGRNTVATMQHLPWQTDPQGGSFKHTKTFRS